MSDEPNLPPVGATVVDGDGNVYLRVSSWNAQSDECESWLWARQVQTLGTPGRVEVPEPSYHASTLTLAWRMQQERDQLKARVAELEEDCNLCERTRTNMRAILNGVVEALKGTPAPLHAHDWSCLPARVADLTVDAALHAGGGAIIDELADEVARLREELAAFRALMQEARTKRPVLDARWRVLATARHYYEVQIDRWAREYAERLAALAPKEGK